MTATDVPVFGSEYGRATVQQFEISSEINLTFIESQNCMRK